MRVILQQSKAITYFHTNNHMKKIFTLIAAAVTMTFTTQAETVTFQLGGNDGATIIQNGAFNQFGSFIGNTNGDTKIEVGEMDFGDGTVFNAASIRYANGWDNGGTAILSAGDDLATAAPFATFELINNGSYTNFRSLGANFTAAPQGAQKVFLTFQGRAGNIQDVRFYNNEFASDQFESGSLLKEPCNWTGYDNMATILDINNAELIYSSSSETRIDNGSWGWTGEGVIVSYGTLNFGNGDYKQVVLELASHWQGDQKDHSVDVYIDDCNDDANRIANVWCGIDPKAKLYLACNIPAIAGEHTVYLKWHGGSINIANVHFVKDYLYSLGNIYYPVVNNEEIPQGNSEPSDNAVRYSFRGQFNGNNQGIVYVGDGSGRTRIINEGQWETDNVGWTKNRTMLRITNVDFLQGGFNEMFVAHSTGWRNDDPNVAKNFKFFPESEVNKINLRQVMTDAGIEMDFLTGMIFNAVTGSSTVDELLNSYDIPQIKNMVGGNGDALMDALFNQINSLTPIATVNMKPSGDWGVVNTTRGELSSLTGTHNIYILYTGPDGANVKDFWLSSYVPVPAPTLVTPVQLAAGEVGNDYKVADGTLECVSTWTDNDETVLLCKDNNGAAIQEPEAGEIDYMGTEYDHSNWIVLRASDPAARLLKGKTLKGVVGKLTSNNELTLKLLPTPLEMTDFYHPNTYIPSSFAGTQVSPVDGRTYFFVTPQPMEYVFVKWAVWDGSQFTAPDNYERLAGNFAADLSLVDASMLEENVSYEMRGIVTTAGGGSGAPRRAAGDTGYELKVLSITEDTQVITGINDVKAESATEAGKAIYFDLTGRRVVNPSAGIYIMNGKKVIVK